MIKWLAHLKTVLHHKRYVMQHCFRVGLYRQGILHDMSKFSPAEFFVGARYYQGNRSPNEAERSEKGYSSAWLHHKGRNKHHLEYWIDYSPVGDHRMTGMEMPVRYVVEMFCDRVAASKTYRKEATATEIPMITTCVLRIITCCTPTPESCWLRCSPCSKMRAKTKPLLISAAKFCIRGINIKLFFMMLLRFSFKNKKKKV